MNTPTGEPYPYPPEHDRYFMAVNLRWIDSERRGNETDHEVIRRLRGLKNDAS